MKNKSLKITTLVLALSVIIGALLCFSSCAFKNFAFGAVDEILGAGDGNEDGNPNNGNSNGATSDDTAKDPVIEDNNDQNDVGGSGTNSDNVGKDEPADDKIEYYPGQGSVPAENISAKNRTLLSGVIIVSNFGLSPSAGSGIIYRLDKETGDAYIITNYHVVYNRNYGLCDSTTLYLYGMKYSAYAIPAKVVGGSVNHDIAVLKVEGSEVLKNSYAVEAAIGNSDNARVFDEVFAVGNAEGYGMAVTEGIISVDSEPLDMIGSDGSAIELRVMRVSAAINEGNSGGGLYNQNGELVGVVCAKRIGSEVDNMAYAIPSNLAISLVENIIHFCDGKNNTKVQRAYIGVTIKAVAPGIVVDGATGDIVKAEIVEVSEITEDCIAKDLIMIGDVVNSITVDGVTVKVTRLYHVTDHMFNARVGSTVTMNVTRGGETFDITFTVPASAFTTVK